MEPLTPSEIIREGDCFAIRDLNLPWRDALGLGVRQTVLKGRVWDMDDVNRSFSYLHRGHVRITTSTGQQRILLNVHAGCIFREVLLLHNSPLHPVHLVAITPCEIYNFPLSLLSDEGFITTHPGLIANLLRSLCVKTGVFTGQLHEESLSPDAMVSRYLYKLAEQHGRQGKINPGISQSDMAHSLGIHRSTVSRVIIALRAEGIIGQFTRCVLEVHDRHALSLRCHFTQ